MPPSVPAFLRGARGPALVLTLVALGSCDGGTTVGPTALERFGPTVRVEGWGAGAGTIQGLPWIDCTYRDGVLTGACEAWVPPGSAVSFVALPHDTASNGVGFDGWGGACASVKDTSCFLNVGTELRTLSAGWPGVTRLQGQLIHPQGRALGPTRVHLEADGASRGSIPAAPDGFFDATLLGSLRGAARVRVVADAADHRARTVYPAWVALEPADLAEPLNLVLLPYRWTVREGIHAGAQIELDLARVLEDEPGLYLTTGRREAGRDWQFQVQSMTRDQFPLTLAFDRVASTVEIRDIDIERYWRRIDELERQYGVDLFAPTDDVASADVRVGISPEACGGATACTDLITDSPFLGRGGVVFHQDSEQFRASRSTVAHELTHILGFGHTCAWPSLMTAGPATCGWEESGRLETTAEDRAYVEAAMTVNTYQKALGIGPYGGGIMAAWNGWRVVVQDREPFVPPGCGGCRN